MNDSIRLTTFEEFLFWEDRPAYPWSCFIRLQLTGRLNREALDSALRRALERHVLLRSRIEQRGRRLHWVAVDNPQPHVTWITGPTGKDMPTATHLDLREEIGLRLFVVEANNDNTCDLTLQFHHACCDGAGIFDFINDLLIAYAQECGETSARVQLPDLEPQRLARRGKYGLSFAKFLKIFRRQLVGLHGARQFLQRTPVPMVPHQARPNDESPPAQYPAILTHCFDREQTKALRDAAKSQDATLNDLLARDLFLAIAEWRRKMTIGPTAENVTESNSATDPMVTGPKPDAGDDVEGIESDWLRMMVPMNLRAAADRLLPAANVVSSVFLDRRGRQCDDPAELLQSIHDEMQLIRDNRLGLTFIFALKISKWLPGGLRKAARKDECTTSCIFTNLGKPLLRCRLPKDDQQLVAGNVVLKQINVLAPVRPYNCVTFSSNQYANRLTITLHYDPRPISATDAAALLDIFVEKSTFSMGHA